MSTCQYTAFPTKPKLDDDTQKTSTSKHQHHANHTNHQDNGDPSTAIEAYGQMRLPTSGQRRKIEKDR